MGRNLTGVCNPRTPEFQNPGSASSTLIPRRIPWSEPEIVFSRALLWAIIRVIHLIGDYKRHLDIILGICTQLKTIGPKKKKILANKDLGGSPHGVSSIFLISVPSIQHTFCTMVLLRCLVQNVLWHEVLVFMCILSWVSKRGT